MAVHAPTAPVTGARPKERLPWVDMARGFCVLAVVLVHVGIFHSFPLSGDPDGNVVLKAWNVVNSAVLAELRMPLLLFLSGWLASSKIRAGLGAPRTRVAVLTNLHIFVVWTLVYFALQVAFVPGGPPTFSGATTLTGLLGELVRPGFGPLWFVWLLVLGLVGLSLARRVPMPVVLLVVALVGLVAYIETGDKAGLPRAFFYAAGAYFGTDLTTKVLPSRRWVAAAAIVAAVFGPIAIKDDVVGYVASVVGCVPIALVFLALSRHLARFAVLRTPGAWLGRRTLGVYVLHWPLVGGLVLLGRAHPEWFTPLLSNTAVAVLYPIVLALAVAGVCLVLDVALRRVGLGILFDPPRRWREWVAHDGMRHRTGLVRSTRA